MDQSDMSLTQFQSLFATEEACILHLFSQRWPSGYVCPRCGAERYSFHSVRKLYQCGECKYQVSVTAGTVFHKTRTPLKKWFWMIFLMTRQKSGVSMMSLQRMLDIKSYKTVWSMGHKIRKAMADRDSGYSLGGLFEMRRFSAEPESGDRSQERGAGASFVVSLEIENDKPGFANFRKIKDSDAPPSPEAPRAKASSVSGAWTIHGISSETQLRRVRANSDITEDALKELRWIRALLSNLKGNIRGVHHGVSSKHLSRYLGEFIYRFNRRFWESQLFNRTLVACVTTSGITLEELMQ